MNGTFPCKKLSTACFSYVNSSTYYLQTQLVVVERLYDDLEVVGSSPLFVNIFLQTKLACWHMSLQLETHSQKDWSVTNQIEFTGLSVFIGCLCRKGQAF